MPGYGESVKVTAAQSHEIPQRPVLVLSAGDAVTVGESSVEWPAFVFVIAADGEGWVPERYLSADRPEAVALVGYDTSELSVEAGQALTVIDRDDESGWWWCRSESGSEGWVPVDVLEAETQS